MADKQESEESKEGEAPAKGGGKTRMIAMIAIGVLALVGVSVGATVFLVGGDDDEEAAEEADADVEKAEKKGKKDKKGKKGKKDKEAKSDKPEAITYLALEPAFVVNFQNPTEARYLQVTMEVMAKDPAAMDDVKKHMPAIRNSLVMLLSGQTQQGIATPEGKEKLRLAATTEIQKILQEHTGKPGIEAVYFTGIVMQ
jgi:flagellar FliL protein